MTSVQRDGTDFPAWRIVEPGTIELDIDIGEHRFRIATGYRGDEPRRPRGPLYSAHMSRSPLLLGTGGERERATRAGVGRICIGGSMLLTTGLGRRIFGIPAAQDNGGGLRLAARLFGIRNVVLGSWALLARDQGVDERRLCYRLNAAVDVADVAVLAWAGIRGDGLLRAALMGGALGGSALLAWLDLLGDVEGAAPERRSAAA